MSDRATLSLLTSSVQTRAFRSNSFNPPPTLGSHRSRRTLSLPAREKPIIPPAISENQECSQLGDERNLLEEETEQQTLSGGTCGEEIGWFSPIAGLLISVALYVWACLLSLSTNNKELDKGWNFYM